MLTYVILSVAGIAFSFWCAVKANNSNHTLALSGMWAVWYVSWLLTCNAFYPTN